MVNKWQSENRLNIRFIRQSNKGKFTTLIETIGRANGEWFLIADSDDEFDANTIDVFLNTYYVQPHNVQIKLAGVSCLVKDSDTGEIVGDIYPLHIAKHEKFLISDVIEICYKFGIRGEKWGILKTSVLKEFATNLLDLNGAKYISEDVLWIPIANKYKTIFINTALRTYYQGTSDTLSHSNIAGRYPLGVVISEKIVLPYIYKYIINRPKEILRRLIKLNYAAIAIGKSLPHTICGFPIGLKILAVAMRPIAYIALWKYPLQNI